MGINERVMHQRTPIFRRALRLGLGEEKLHLGTKFRAGSSLDKDKEWSWMTTYHVRKRMSRWLTTDWWPVPERGWGTQRNTEPHLLDTPKTSIQDMVRAGRLQSGCHAPRSTRDTAKHLAQLAHSDMHTPYTCFPISSTQTHLIQLIPLQDYCWVNTFSVVGDESILEFQSKIVESLQNEHR